MSTIHAIYEGGIFRPLDPVHLPDHSEVSFDPRPVLSGIASELAAMDMEPDGEELHSILRRTYDTGRSDLAARHDEHQP